MIPEQSLEKSKVQTYDAFLYHWYVWQFCGLKPPANPQWRTAYLVYGVILNLTVTVTFPVTLVINCFLSENVSKLCENFYMTVTDVMCNLKFLNVYIVRPKLISVKAILDDLDTRAKTEAEVQALKRGIQSAYNCFYLFGGLFGVALITSQLTVYMAKERILMYPAWFPLDWKNSYHDFVIAHSYQVYGLTIQAIQNLSNDTYPQAYLTVLCAHIEALSVRMSNLGKQKTVSHDRHYRELVQCINDHETIIELQENIQSIISTACLAQFTSSALAQCTMAIYLLYTGFELAKLVHIMIFFTAVTLEMLTLCHYGDLLCQRNEQLATAIYSCHWIDQSKKFKLALLLVLRRAQKPFIIMAWNLIPVTLPTFVQVMKTAYSTFALLSEMK